MMNISKLIGNRDLWKTGHDIGLCALPQDAPSEIPSIRSERSVCPPVVVVDYDPRWPILYEDEKNRILSVVGDIIVVIEHIGSTAVPGLGGKPIIDIMVAVRNLADAERCIEPLESIGFEYVPEYEIAIPERRYFRKGPQKNHRHLHVVELTSRFWRDHLLFRDYLRSHPDLAQQYHQLKTELATKHKTDGKAYTDSKTSFIKSVISQAKAMD